MCAKVTVIVNDLKAEHADIDIVAVKIGDGDSRKVVEDSDLKVHGIIAKDAAGEIVTTVEGHSYGKEKVEEVIELLTATE
ncbi:MAG: hypothetical protein P1U58_19420 [Verrucomicrobiales bacterium]|nr:hypothetical protein [Verrucomicrobiales bacterium]